MLAAKNFSVERREPGRWGKVPFGKLSFALRRNLFYAGLRSYEKAEFIDGKPVIDSPVLARHVWVSGRLAHLFRCYARRFDANARVGVEKALVALRNADYEPDLCYWKGARAAHIRDDKWRLPVPDFIVEILSKDFISRDRVKKKYDYARNGVTEYWIIDPLAETVEQFILDENGQYILQAEGNTLICFVLEGLTFDKSALFSEEANDAVCLALSFPTMQEAVENAQKEAEQARKEARAAFLAEKEALKEAEALRLSEKSARKEAETLRLSEENTRKEAKTLRLSEENARKEAETLRLSEENARKENMKLKRNFVLNLRKKGINEVEIAELTGLTTEEIEKF